MPWPIFQRGNPITLSAIFQAMRKRKRTCRRIAELEVDVVHRMPNGLVVNMDRSNALRIAAMRDQGDKLVDFLAGLRLRINFQIRSKNA